MLKKITVLGHKNQDTDATVAAIGLAELFKSAGIFRSTAKIANAPNRETIYVLKRFGVKKPGTYQPKKGDVVFLVDFNEEAQSPAIFKDVQIEGLVDHHKLNICFAKDYPIMFRVEPVGSSSTIVAKMYQDYKIKPTKTIAGLLLGGIVSDTLKFSSPTTTPEDIQVAKVLASIAKVSIPELAQKMFEAKSDLTGMKGKDIITMDYKEFAFGKYKTGIGVLETVDPSSALKLEQEIRGALSEYKGQQKIDLIFFGLVDILKNSTTLLLVGNEEEEIAVKVFSRKIQNGIMHLPGVVSRKKQIVPAFMSKLAK